MSTRALYTPRRGPVPDGHPHAPPSPVLSEAGELILGLEDLWPATREQRQELVWKFCKRYPGKTETEALDELSKMAPGDLYLMVINRHPAFDDLGIGGHSSDYDALAAPPQRYDAADNLGPLAPPSRASVGRSRSWYD